MANEFLYMGTYGPEDPTRATLVFAAALGMANHLKEGGSGGTVRVALLGQGVLLMNAGIAGSIAVVGDRSQGGRRSILDLMNAARDQKVEIHC
jgi:hypothetical protein